MLRSRVLIVFVFDLSFVEVEKSFENVFEAAGLLIGIAREGLPLAVKKLLSGEITEDEEGMEEHHDPHEQECWDRKNCQNNGEGVLLEGQSEVFLPVDKVVVHDDDAHREGDDQSHKEREQKKEKLFVIAFPNAGAQPRTVMVHFLNADSTYIAVTGSGRSIDVASKAKFNLAHLESLGYNITDLNVALNVLVLGNGQVVALSFVLFVLG